MSELKPCPFCGGNQQEVREVGDCGELFSVMCGCGGESDYHESDWSAVNQWNKRPTEEALSERIRLKEEENQQLQQDKAELVELVESAYIEGCHDGYREGLSDGQDYSSSKNNLEPDESWDISESKAKLEKHKCD